MPHPRFRGSRATVLREPKPEGPRRARHDAWRETALAERPLDLHRAIPVDTVVRDTSAMRTTGYRCQSACQTVTEQRRSTAPSKRCSTRLCDIDRDISPGTRIAQTWTHVFCFHGGARKLDSDRLIGVSAICDRDRTITSAAIFDPRPALDPRGPCFTRGPPRTRLTRRPHHPRNAT
jgi:hypothetical protein